MKKKKMSGIQILNKIVIYTWCASPVTFIVVAVTSLMLSCLGFLELYTIEKLFDGAVHVAEVNSIEILNKTIITLLIILILNPIIDWLEYLSRGYFWRRGSGYMKSLYHSRISHMKSIDFEDSKNIDELHKASLGSEDAPNGLRVILQIIFLYIPYTLFLLIYLISIKAILAFIIILIFLPTLALEIIKMKKNFDFEDRIANERRKSEYFQNCIISKEYHKDTLINGSFEFFYNLLNKSNEEFGKFFITMKKQILKIAILMKMLNAVGFLSVLCLLVYYVYKGSISIGLFAAVYYSISKITGMFRRAISDIGEALVGISNTSFLIQLLNDNENMIEEEQIINVQDICLENVSFSYPNAKYEALKDINLTIKEGSSLAIVGDNGSGKSTLTKIILGLYNPTHGQVTYAHNNLKNYSYKLRFSKNSAVFQDFMKYKLSLEENVKISNFDSEINIDESLIKADINLSKLNVNKDTIMSREYGGYDLSGGEWQRLAIARGVYRPHELIILDEPTASIDPIEEANVFNSFKNINNGKTCVFVTHRLGSVLIADKIIVMENGEIVEEGTHKELIENKGTYYRLFESQAQWYRR